MKIDEVNKLVHSHASVGRGMARRWWHWRGGGSSTAQVFWRTNLWHAAFGFDDEDGWKFSAYVGPVGVYLATTLGKWARLDRDREVSISAHGGAIWWSVWRDPMGGWDRSVPRWRDGNFNFVDAILGREKCTHETVEERDVLVPMPERAYPASVKLERWTWKRPRWLAKSFLRCSIEVPGGIPHAGKGTSSWNCGDDATFGITTGRVRSIPHGVSVLVGSCLEDRVKYGGWDDWSWERRP